MQYWFPNFIFCVSSRLALAKIWCGCELMGLESEPRGLWGAVYKFAIELIKCKATNSNIFQTRNWFSMMLRNKHLPQRALVVTQDGEVPEYLCQIREGYDMSCRGSARALGAKDRRVPLASCAIHRDGNLPQKRNWFAWKVAHDYQSIPLLYHHLEL